MTATHLGEGDLFFFLPRDAAWNWIEQYREDVNRQSNCYGEGNHYSKAGRSLGLPPDIAQSQH